MNQKESNPSVTPNSFRTDRQRRTLGCDINAGIVAGGL